MSDPSRLRDDLGSEPFERVLLQSASLDREPEDGAMRALAALGVGSTVGAAGLAESVKHAPMSAASTSVGASMTLKIAGIVLLAAGGLGAVLLARRATPPAPSSSMAVVVDAPSADAPSPQLSSAPPLITIAEPAPAMMPSARRSLTAPSAVTKASSAPSMSEELALIDEARAALLGGDPGRAEKALATYDARFPLGALSLEAKLARIELQLARSDGEGARILCERFLRDHPRTAYERRARALLRRAERREAISQ